MKQSQKLKANSIHELAVALCEKRNVWFHCHTIRLVEFESDSNPCDYCTMDCLCDMEMKKLCIECSSLLRKQCMLKLVLAPSYPR